MSSSNEYRLFVVGDNVRNASEVVTVRASSEAELRSSLGMSVHFNPPDCNQITFVQYLDPHRNQWQPVPDDLQGLSTSSDAPSHVHISCQKNAGLAQDVTFLRAVVEVFLMQKSDESERQSLRQALQAARNSLPADATSIDILSSTAFQHFTNAARSSSNSAGESNESQGPRKAGPSGARKAAPLANSTPTAAGASTAATNSSTASAASSQSILRQSQSTVVLAANNGGCASDPYITVYCVYSGTNAQRAKAVRVLRNAPSVAALLKVLRQKFNTDLVLGFIDADGSCTEITKDEDFTKLLDAKGGRNSIESVALHCWAKTGLADVNASVASSTADARSGGVGSGSTSGALKPARPASAMSRASSSGTSPSKSKPTVTPQHAMDVSGVAWTDAQLRELFEQLDTNGSGTLSKEEMMAYFNTHHDSMGLDNASKRFEKFLDSSGAMQDGQLTFEEFSVIMLKVAQW